MNQFVTFLCIAAFQWIQACATKDPSTEQQSKTQYKGSVSEIFAVEARADRSPNFTWTDDAGRKVTFDQFHNKVTVLNFWATWCGPCRREIPDLEAIHKEYADKGVRVIGVSVDRGPGILDEVAKFVRSYNVSYPVVIDNGDLEQIFGNIRAIPTTFIINKEGKIVERFVGQRTKEAFLEKITPIL